MMISTVVNSLTSDLKRKARNFLPISINNLPFVFFPLGEEEKLLKIPILEDSQPEGDESIFVVLTRVQLLQGDPNAGEHQESWIVSQGLRPCCRALDSPCRPLDPSG